MSAPVDQHVYPGEFLIALIFASNGIVLLLVAALSPTAIGTVISLVFAVALYLLANWILLHRHQSQYLGVAVAALMCVASVWSLTSGIITLQAIVAIPSMGWAAYYLLRYRERWSGPPNPET
jgi:hypothetical protein